MPLRIVFMGTPEFSVPTLNGLADAGHTLVQAYTRPPAAGGRRGRDLVKSPVHQAAERLEISVSTPKTLKDNGELEKFKSFQADVAVVVAYGLLLPEQILKAPAFGCWNGHASLLPRWRGAAPIQRAIMAGDERTGVNIMRMEEGLDTGPVALSGEVEITPSMDGAKLHDTLSELTAVLMVKAMEKLEAGKLKAVDQDETGVTYARKIEKAEARIDWDRPAAEVHNHMRGLSPFPGAWFEADLGTGKLERVKVLAGHLVPGGGEAGTVLDDRLTVACASGALQLTRVQRAGRKPQNADEFLRGCALAPGTRLS